MAYLGTTILDSCDGTPFEGFTSQDWAMEFIERYGQIDGSHHKSWVLDQVARILKGTPVMLSVAKWDDGKEEYRYSVQSPPSREYIEWVAIILGDGEYDYDGGIAP